MLTRKAVQIGGAVLLLLVFSQVGMAQRYGRNRGYNQRQGSWVYLGEANVDGNLDHDNITVGRSDGRFRALRIRVERAPIEFQRVIVHYANGESEELQLRDKIRAGGTTQAMDLRGGDRAINSVEFWYGRASYRSTRPKLRLYGR